MITLDQLKLCFLAGTLGQGGAEQQLYYILRALCQNGCRPRLLCLTQGEFWEKRIQDLGVEVRWVGQSKSRPARLYQIVAELRRQRPDVFQSLHFYTNSYVATAARLLGLRDVGAIRSTGMHEVKSNGRVLGNLHLRAPRFLAANSKPAIRYAAEQGVPMNRLHFLPNVVDTGVFQPAEKQPNGVVTLIAVGRLSKEKRFDRFLDLLAAIRRTSKMQIRGLIVGSGRGAGNLAPQLEQQARELGLLPGVVEFRGGVANMAPVYREADLCILTSDREGTPNVLLEAMASGLPVVATRVGGVPDMVIDETTGYLVEPEDKDGLLRSILPLVENPDARQVMGCRARSHVEANFSVRQLPSYLEKLYRASLS